MMTAWEEAWSIRRTGMTSWRYRRRSERSRKMGIRTGGRRCGLRLRRGLAMGGWNLSRLSAESQKLIQRQVMAPTWRLDSQGRRVVEAKAETKRRIGRSPDDADALNLAFAPVPRLETDRALWVKLWERGEEWDLMAGW